MAAMILVLFFNDPLTVEFLAILWGLQLCLPPGLEKLILERDAHVAIYAINQGEDSYV